MRARQTVLLAGLPAGPARAAVAHLGLLVARLLEPGAVPLQVKDPTVDLSSLMRSGLVGFQEFLSEAGAGLGGPAPAAGPRVDLEVPVDLTAEVAAAELLSELARDRAPQAEATAGPVAPVPEDVGVLAGWIVREVADQLRGASPRPWPA